MLLRSMVGLPSSVELSSRAQMLLRRHWDLIFPSFPPIPSCVLARASGLRAKGQTKTEKGKVL